MIDTRPCKYCAQPRAPWQFAPGRRKCNPCLASMARARIAAKTRKPYTRQVERELSCGFPSLMEFELHEGERLHRHVDRALRLRLEFRKRLWWIIGIETIFDVVTMPPHIVDHEALTITFKPLANPISTAYFLSRWACELYGGRPVTGGFEVVADERGRGHVLAKGRLLPPCDYAGAWSDAAPMFGVTCRRCLESTLPRIRVPRDGVTPAERTELTAASRAGPAAPAWSRADPALVAAMVSVYEHAQRLSGTPPRAVQYAVDHVIPLRGYTVCGLHLPANLAAVESRFNVRKSNTFDVNS